jgi:histidine ammonia-lyase
MTNEIEAFSTALANMDAAVAQRIERFSDRGPTPFFTGIKPTDVLTPEQIRKSPSMLEPYFAFMDVWADIQNTAHTVTAEGNASDFGVADVEAYSRLKGQRGRTVVDQTYQLLAYDLLISSYWLDVRKAEDAKRDFGAGPTAAWTEFRKTVPWQAEPDDRPDLPFGAVAYRWLKANPADKFYPTGPKMPETDSEFIPGVAEPKK